MSTRAIRLTAPPAVPPAVRPRKGVAVALLLSLALHAVVILGLIDWFQDAPDSPSIVRATLARMSGPPATSPSTADSEPARPVGQSSSAGPASGTDKPAETPLRPVPNPAIAKDIDPITPEVPGQRLDYAATVRQIANLDTRYPTAQARVRRIVEGQPQTPEDAWYLESWRRKVERIGKLNYPDEARVRKIYGSLRLLVAIEPDGTLQDVRVIDSSGHQVLDEAAVRIVRLAAPYAPFPPAMRDETDMLEIVRTWRFKKRGSATPS